MKKNKNTQDNFEDFNPYEVDKLSKVPVFLIVILLKFWAAAAAVFFMTIGGLDIGVDFTSPTSDTIEYNFNVSFMIIVLIALGMAVVFNYGIKQLIFMAHNRRRNTFRYYMIPLKGFSAFLLHLVYMFIVSLILYFLTVYLGSKNIVFNPFSGENNGIEPITYGICFVIVDGIFVSIKDLIIAIVQYVKYKRQINDNTPIIVEKGA